jgi:hypothetical protein
MERVFFPTSFEANIKFVNQEIFLVLAKPLAFPFCLKGPTNSFFSRMNKQNKYLEDDVEARRAIEIDKIRQEILNE